ncbi:hypothetical protein DL98DRAFT_412248, partial [Cadophora sp. DSE1049]
AAFTKNNIIYTFTKSGIWPINKEVILAKIRKLVLYSKTLFTMKKTPFIIKAIRKFIIRF